MKVAVIIAGYNAEKTIARAINSALAQQEVAEVIVVDDASTDSTREVARQCDDGTERLQVLKQSKNQGPSAARNRGIKASTAPFVAILDSDDVILTGRFKDMLRNDDWDVIVDDIAFVSEALSLEEAMSSVRRESGRLETLDLARFVIENIPRKDRDGRELGFMKPLIRREFLEEKSIGYSETMRLSEDYEFYCRLMISGARFKVLHKCGYLAFVRSGSLSRSHSISDLEQIVVANNKFLMDTTISDIELRAIRQHQNHHIAKVQYRKVLDTNKLLGFWSAIEQWLAEPNSMLTVLRFWVIEKYRALIPKNESKSDFKSINYLLK